MAPAMVGRPHPLTTRFAAGFLVAGAVICAFSGCRQSPVNKDPSLARVPSTPLRELESGYTVQAPDVLALHETDRHIADRGLPGLLHGSAGRMPGNQHTRARGPVVDRADRDFPDIQFPSRLRRRPYR